MNSKDIQYVALALGIILVMAIVVKPIITGQPLNTGISLLSPTPEPTPAPTWIPDTSVVPTIIPTIQTPTPTPNPTWNGNSQSVSFVDPTQYQVNLTHFTPRNTTQSSANLTRQMVTYATIKGKYSGTTDVITIPFPYWELSYTIEPSTGLGGSKTDAYKDINVGVTPTRRTSNASTRTTSEVETLSASTVNPIFTITVMDYNDPNRIVRVISPPGGVNLALWKSSITESRTYADPVTGRTKTETITTPLDPRPWTETFYEGNHAYYFVITSRYIDSYTLNILVPKDYVGKY